MNRARQQGTRPTGGDNCTRVTDWDRQPSIRAGFYIYRGGMSNNHLFQDNLAYGGGSVGLGFSCGGCHPFTNSTIRRMTMFGNGLSGASCLGGAAAHADVDEADLSRFVTVQDHKIERMYNRGSVSPLSGGGARLGIGYVDGILMDGSKGPSGSTSRSACHA